MSACLKETRNWSGDLEPNAKFDSVVYNQGVGYGKAHINDIDLKTVYTKNNLGTRSPKLLSLAKNIYRLDLHDHKTHGQTFKHFIFSNSTNEYGAKLIASMLQTMLNLKPIMELKKDNGGTVVKVGEGGSNHYGLLTPSHIMKNPYEDDFKKKMLKRFNSRDNIHGKYMRFIILDSVYKEGISLENVRYVHLFEPLPTLAQEKQAVARAIRFCSHQSTIFEENEGWTVQVHVYKLFTPKGVPVQIYDPSSNTYVEKTDVDVDNLLYELESSANERYMSNLVDLLEAVSPVLSVDFFLTDELIPKPKSLNPPLQDEVDTIWSEKIPETSLAFYVGEKYEKNRIQTPERVNNCLVKSVYLTKFQRYLADFVSSKKSRLGMLLWHSPGSGKTCTAMHIVKTLVDKGYPSNKVCWATTKALGKDGVTCQLKDTDITVPHPTKLALGVKDPTYIGQVYNYKQLAAHLKDYNQDGSVVVIDEAHLLVSDELGPNEILRQSHLDNIRIGILKQWNKKTEKPLRVIFLTGTPVANPVYFFKLLNLLREPDHAELPQTMAAIQERYNKNDGKFDLSLLRDDLDGYISFLDTKMDVSRFAQRTASIVNVSEMSMRNPESEEVKMIEVNENVIKYDKQMKTTVKKYLHEMKQLTRKKGLEEDFLSDIEKVGNLYFENKQKQQELTKKKFTRKASHDFSQESSLRKCGVLKATQADVELQQAYLENV